MNNKNPFFTICIPTYNRANLLGNCLNSLVEQQFKDFEVIVVDDGSLDRTKDICKEFANFLNIKYFYKENGGKHTALNIGIKESSESMFFMILDSDDILTNDALEFFHSIWKLYWVDSKLNEYNLCGVCCKCSTCDNKIIGKKFPHEAFIFSYIDMHFNNMHFGDCNEIIRTNIIKQYSFPEPKGTKFVPEYYIFDQIGLNGSLISFNKVTCIKDYLSDGISMNHNSFIINNSVGYTYAQGVRIDKVLPYIKNRVKFKSILDVWGFYWYVFDLSDKTNRYYVNTFNIYFILSKIKFILKKFLNKIS